MILISQPFGEDIPDEGAMMAQFDDSIIQDTAAEKAQDTQEVGITLDPYEYRMRWMGEDEATARVHRKSVPAPSAPRASRARMGEGYRLLRLQLDPLVALHELDAVAARLGDLDEGIGARVAPAADEGAEVHSGLAERLGDAHDAHPALLAHVLDGLGDPHGKPTLYPPVVRPKSIPLGTD